MHDPSAEQRLSRLIAQTEALQRQLDELRLQIAELVPLMSQPGRPARPAAEAAPAAPEAHLEPIFPVDLPQTPPQQPLVPLLDLGALAARVRQTSQRAEAPPVPQAFPAGSEVSHEGVVGGQRMANAFRGAAARAASESAAASPGGAELIIGRTWLNRIGAVILFLGIAFFAKYSFDQGWVSPTMRVVLAAAAGVALIALGEFCLWREMRPVAGGLIGSGLAALYVAVFGAYNFYHLVGPTTAFVLYLAVTCISVAIAITAGSLPLAVLGLIGGYCTPLALNTGTNQQVALLTYVLLLDVGFVTIAIFRRWHVLIPLAWVGTLILFGGWAVKFYEPAAVWRTWLFLAGFYAVFHAGLILGARRARPVVDRLLSTVVYADNAVFFVVTYFMWHEQFADLLGAFAVVAGGLQWLIAWRVVSREETARLVRIAFWIGGAAMLAMAAPLQFDRYLVSIGWCVQAAATIAFCRKFDDLWLRVKGLAVWSAAVAHLFAFDLHDAALAERLLESEHFFLSTAMLMFFMAWLTSVVSAMLLVVRRIPTKDDAVAVAFLVWAGSLLFLWTTAHFWDRYVATLCWCGLAAGYWLVARQAPAAIWVARALTAAAAAKFMSWDSLMADRSKRADMTVAFNRAVLAGLATSAAAYLGRRIDPEPVLRESQNRSPIAPGDVLAWASLILLTWTGTIEVLRAFGMDDWVRSQFRQPELVQGPAVTILWCTQAAVLWVFLRAHWRNVLLFTLVLSGLAVLKFFVFDTMGIMATGEWRAIRGIALNAPCWSGAGSIALMLLAHVRLGRLNRAGSIGFPVEPVQEALLLGFAMLVTWLPTYEIARVFRVEPFRESFADPRFAMHFSLSVLWGLNATALLIVGFIRRRGILRYSALGLYIVTIIKVFLYDLAALQTLYRIVSFVILGLLLLFASILYQKMSGRIAERGGG